MTESGLASTSEGWSVIEGVPVKGIGEAPMFSKKTGAPL
jgi:hypothetical protein